MKCLLYDVPPAIIMLFNLWSFRLKYCFGFDFYYQVSSYISLCIFYKEHKQWLYGKLYFYELYRSVYEMNKSRICILIQISISVIDFELNKKMHNLSSHLIQFK